MVVGSVGATPVSLVTDATPNYGPRVFQTKGPASTAAVIWSRMNSAGYFKHIIDKGRLCWK